MSEALKFLKAYVEDEGFDADDDSILLEFLEEDGPIVHHEDYDERRWWTETFNVTEINGRLIGWYGAKTTGDASAEERGWEFEPTEVHFVERRTKTVVIEEFVAVSEQG
jgi:hypothetical protein